MNEEEYNQQNLITIIKGWLVNYHHHQNLPLFTGGEGGRRRKEREGDVWLDKWGCIDMMRRIKRASLVFLV